MINNLKCSFFKLRTKINSTEMSFAIIFFSILSRLSKATHQFTPSASTQANLYSLTLNISWRQPATHWTYWELCRGQGQTFTHAGAGALAVDQENKASVRGPITISAVLKHGVVDKQIQKRGRRPVQYLQLPSQIKPEASHMHAHRFATHARSTHPIVRYRAIAVSHHTWAE